MVDKERHGLWSASGGIDVGEVDQRKCHVSFTMLVR